MASLKEVTDSFINSFHGPKPKIDVDGSEYNEAVDFCDPWLEELYEDFDQTERDILNFYAVRKNMPRGVDLEWIEMRAEVAFLHYLHSGRNLLKALGHSVPDSKNEDDPAWHGFVHPSTKSFEVVGDDVCNECRAMMMREANWDSEEE